MATLHSIWTLLLFTAFIAIVIWAWSDKRKRDFAAAARLPLDDDRIDEHDPQSGDREARTDG